MRATGSATDRSICLISCIAIGVAIACGAPPAVNDSNQGVHMQHCGSRAAAETGKRMAPKSCATKKAHPDARCAGKEKPKPVEKKYKVPYHLTATDHVVVRAKFNGVGPFWFIVDTGAPMLIVSEQVVETVGLEIEPDCWVTIDRLEIEGGPTLERADAWVEDIYQLRGMTGLGLPGTPLHGVLGYSVLAHYRIELDLAQPYMVWTELQWQPPSVRKRLWLWGITRRSRGSRGGGPQELEALGSLMQQIGSFLGRSQLEPRVPRGCLGVLLEESNGSVFIKRVLDGTPAAEAGLKAGDKIVRFDGRPVESLQKLLELAKQYRAGRQITVVIERGGKEQPVQVTLIDGF